MLRFDAHLPLDVRRMFEECSANDIVDAIEKMDILMISEGWHHEMTEEFFCQHRFVMYHLKKAVRALEPPKIPAPNCN